jgi:ATP-dependent protease Clp ATPase subunit
MFELPEKENIGKCIITRDVVEKGEAPIYIEGKPKKSAQPQRKTSESA